MLAGNGSDHRGAVASVESVSVRRNATEAAPSSSLKDGSEGQATEPRRQKSAASGYSSDGPSPNGPSATTDPSAACSTPRVPSPSAQTPVQ